MQRPQPLHENAPQFSGYVQNLCETLLRIRCALRALGLCPLASRVNSDDMQLSQLRRRLPPDGSCGVPSSVILKQ